MEQFLANWVFPEIKSESRKGIRENLVRRYRLGFPTYISSLKKPFPFPPCSRKEYRGRKGERASPGNNIFFSLPAGLLITTGCQKSFSEENAGRQNHLRENLQPTTEGTHMSVANKILGSAINRKQHPCQKPRLCWRHLVCS